MKSKASVILLVATYAIVVFGIVMVYSASSYSAQIYYSNDKHFFYKQIIGAVLGTVALVFTYFIDFNYYKKFKWVWAIVGIIILALVFVPGIGVSNYGARRWIGLPGFTIQASEIAKFCFVMFCACYLCDKYDRVKKFSSLLPIFAVGGGMCLLIMLEPNMSITMCVGLVMLVLLFVGGIKWKHFLVIAIPALLLVPVLIIIEPYRLSRLMAFINPWAQPQGEGYQLIQSLYSLGNGGLFGVGLFNSRQKYLFLPFSESDFIFSIIAEEFGLFGAIVLLIVFLVMVICGIKIAISSPNRFGCLVSTGIISIIAVQVLLNIAVVTGSIPPTGLPLPFISSGSSSLIVFMAGIGVLLNINKNRVMVKRQGKVAQKNRKKNRIIEKPD